MPSPFLEVRDLHKRFGSLDALRGVTIQIDEGEIFGLLGPNGAGKTTLLSILSGWLEPDRGSLLLQGKPFSPQDRHQRTLLGLVPQELAIYQELSARENLRFFGELYGQRGQRLSHRIDSILHAVGLAPHADQRTGTFSGGMKRRLNLGVSLVHRPKLLFLDEPTVGVDAQSRNHIFEEVQRLHREGTTIIYTTHYMEEVQALCPRIGILDNGRIIACDRLDSLVALLPGRIYFSVPVQGHSHINELRSWTDARLFEDEAGHWVLETKDVKSLIVRLANWLQRHGLEFTSLRVEDADLQRVFLHLTGKKLRD